MNEVYIQGLKFNNITMNDAVDYAIERIKSGEKTMAVTPNAEIAYSAKKNEELKNIINSSDLILPDGIGIIYAAKILGTPLKERVAGIDFAEKLLERLNDERISVFLLGAKPGVAKKAAEKLSQRYGSLDVAGIKDGYFSDDSEVIDEINKSEASAVFVCLGSPKQEQFMFKYKEQINASFMIGLGGSFDVFSGNVKRAPLLLRKLGLEWFYRLVKDPKRIGRSFKLPLFILSVFKDKMLKSKKMDV